MKKPRRNMRRGLITKQLLSLVFLKRYSFTNFRTVRPVLVCSSR